MMRWRVGFAALFLFCAGAIAFALYHQFYQWLMPCLMCVYERIAIIVIGLLALCAVVYVPKSRLGVLIWCDLMATAAVIGLGVSTYHVMLQYGPRDASISCASSLPFPINLNDPFWPEWFAALIRPVGDCSTVDFTVFGVSMPIWLMLTFIGITGFVVMMGVQRWRALPARVTQGVQQ